MKNSMIISLLRQGNIVIPLFMFKFFDKFKLKMDEFIFLIYLYNIGDKEEFNPEKYSNDLNIDLLNIMQYIDVLSNKNLLKVDVVKEENSLAKEIISLEGFYNKLNILIMGEVNNVNNNSNNSCIFELIEKEFGRTLSPMEYEIIKAWLDSGTNEELIKEALKEATFNGVNNLRYIDKILYEWGKNNIKTVKDVENNRKKRNTKNKTNNEDISLDGVDWNWFDEDE